MIVELRIIRTQYREYIAIAKDDVMRNGIHKTLKPIYVGLLGLELCYFEFGEDSKKIIHNTVETNGETVRYSQISEPRLDEEEWRVLNKISSEITIV